MVCSLILLHSASVFSCKVILVFSYTCEANTCVSQGAKNTTSLHDYMSPVPASQQRRISLLSVNLSIQLSPSVSEREKAMVFLSLRRPLAQDQKACIEKSGSFNYDSKYIGATAKPISTLQKDEHLSKEGFFLNHSRVLVGSGVNTYEKGKHALQTWRHFGLGWTFVDPKSPIEVGAKFCVCVKEFLPWLMMPLQVAYVKENKDPKKLNASFGFGSGTLQGHLLAGEERFSIELDENNQVWYEVLSFSKPAHFLSFIGYPYVQLRQKYFAHQSANAVLKHVTQQQP